METAWLGMKQFVLRETSLKSNTKSVDNCNMLKLAISPDSPGYIITSSQLKTNIIIAVKMIRLR